MCSSDLGDPATRVRVLIDGRAVEAVRGISVVAAGTVGADQEIQVKLPERDCEVAVIAENKNAASEPGRARYRWAGQRIDPDAFAIKPKLYALLVGVSEYADESIRLRFAAKDARDLAAALEKLKGGLYRDVTVKLLTDGQG